MSFIVFVDTISKMCRSSRLVKDFECHTLEKYFAEKAALNELSFCYAASAVVAQLVFAHTILIMLRKNS